MTVTRPECHGNGQMVVKALNEAITATMNEFGDRHGCGPMHWYLREVNGFDRGDVIGFPGGPNDQDTLPGIRLTESWAQLLGLIERDDEVGGYRAWTGTAGTSRIEIDLVPSMTSRKRQQLALFDLPKPTRRRSSRDALEPDAPILRAAPTAAPNRSGRSGSRVPAGHRAATRSALDARSPD